MKKAERERMERNTYYKVFPTYKGSVDNGTVFTVQKYIYDEQEEQYNKDENYNVTIVWPSMPGEGVPKMLVCGCPGFRMQKYAHIDHKHIKLVIRHQKLGSPPWSVFRIKGTGAHAEVEWIEDAFECEECPLDVGYV